MGNRNKELVAIAFEMFQSQRPVLRDTVIVLTEEKVGTVKVEADGTDTVVRFSPVQYYIDPSQLD